MGSLSIDFLKLQPPLCLWWMRSGSLMGCTLMTGSIWKVILFLLLVAFPNTFVWGELIRQPFQEEEAIMSATIKWGNSMDQGLYWVINPCPQCTWWLILKGTCKFYLFFYVFCECDKWVRYIEPHFKNSYFGRKVPFLLWKWSKVLWKDVD